MATKGSATLDFGAAPAAEASVTVTTSGLSAGSHIEAFAMSGDSTGDNDAAAHRQLAAFSRFSCRYIDATHFAIDCDLLRWLAAGQFAVRWIFD